MSNEPPTDQIAKQLTDLGAELASLKVKLEKLESSGDSKKIADVETQISSLKEIIAALKTKEPADPVTEEEYKVKFGGHYQSMFD